MSYGKIFVGRAGWCIRVWRAGQFDFPERTWTHLSPGPVIDDIVLEHNGVGACIAGELTFSGFCGWEPRSRVVEVFYGPEPLHENRLGVGIVGIIRGKKAENGARTSNVPLLGLHTRDENGLASLGLSEIGPFVNDRMYVLGSYKGAHHMPDRFGLTVDGAIKELFGDRVDSSWGVRPDGIRLAAYPGASGTVAVWDADTERWQEQHISLDPLEIDANAAGVAYEDSGYEEPSFITEAQWRLTERHKVHTYVRETNGLTPRRGSTEEQGMGELKPSERVLHGAEEQAEAHTGGFVRAVNLPNLIRNSLANPDAFNAMYELHGVEVTVEVEATFEPEETDVYKSEDKKKITREAHPTVNLKWGEWLANPAGEAEVLQEAEADHRPVVYQSLPTSTASTSSDKDGDVRSVTINNSVKDVRFVAEPEPFTETATKLNLEDAYRTAYLHSGTLTPHRPKLVWRFAAPDALLRMIDGSVPKVDYEVQEPLWETVGGERNPVMVENPETGEQVQATKTVVKSTTSYNWCAGLAYTAHRKSTSVSMKVSAVVVYEKRVQGKGQPDFPGMELPFTSPPTFNGQIYGALAYGPITLTGLESAAGGTCNQAVTNSRMVIAKENLRTEFQTAAAQRSSNGTPRNMVNVRNFGVIQ